MIDVLSERKLSTSGLLPPAVTCAAYEVQCEFCGFEISCEVIVMLFEYLCASLDTCCVLRPARWSP